MNAWSFRDPSCGGIAFLYLKEPKRGERVLADFVLYPDGRTPKPGERARCYECKRVLPPSDWKIEYFEKPDMEG